MGQEKLTDKQEPSVFQHDFFHTTGVTDFVFKNVPNPPSGYPEKGVPDRYVSTPFKTDYDSRKKALLDYCCRNPAGPTIKGYYYELARLQKGQGPIYEGLIAAALTYIDDRYDCSDFVLLGIIRILYQFMDSALLTTALKEKIEQTILGFKYWPDEPGIDSMCYWTENHQIMFAANEYLSGQKFPERIFKNSGMTGKTKKEIAEKRIFKWLELRYKTGFSEWLSHIYYDEDITALINLIDFCDNEKIVTQAKIVLDLIFYDMALNSFHGVFGSSHGRSYTEEKKNGLRESTIDTQKLAFGMGVFAGHDNMSSISLALSDNYRLPRVIYEIANNYDREEIVNCQRMGIKINEAARWGLDCNDIEDGLILLSLEAYAHPKTITTFIKMLDEFGWWENQFFSDFKKYRTLISVMQKTGLLPLLTRIIEKDICRNTREEVNVYTYRTPDYMLSAAQDYRRGYGGDQQHIFQATLGPGAVCFATHPGHKEDTSGGYWVGSGTLPRVAQIKNLLIASYNASKMPGLLMTNKLFFTHAWFPKKNFHEVVEKSGWIFGRKENGYIALYSQNGYRWQTKGEDRDKEVIAGGRKNIWICEMGRKAIDGDFNTFVEKITASDIRFKDMRVTYHSPSQGKVEFGWNGHLVQNGEIVNLHDYPRYDNPYTQAVFPPKAITIEHGSHSLTLDLENELRQANEFI